MRTTLMPARRPSLLLFLLPALVLAGCATLPPVALRYYAPRAAPTVAVERSLVCDKSRDTVLVADVVDIGVTYSADLRRPYVLHFGNAGVGTAEIGVNLSADGRLLAVNSAVDGVADSAIRPAFNLAVLALRGAGALATPPSAACDVLARLAGDKPLTLHYTIELDSAGAGTASALPLRASAASRALDQQLAALALPPLTVSASVTPLAPAAAAEGSAIVPDDSEPGAGGSPALLLPATAALRLIVRSGDEVIAERTLTVPAPGAWRLPLPAPILLGKQDMALTLSDAGAVTSLHYGKSSASAGLAAGFYAGAASLAAGASTPSDAAAALKAQADLIVQQQRLLLCQARPADCK
jgi:hypothetical protein